MSWIWKSLLTVAILLAWLLILQAPLGGLVKGVLDVVCVILLIATWQKKKRDSESEEST